MSSKKHSTAAMDCEPPLSATKRISVAEKRLGPRGDMKSKPETTGHRIYVSNLHHKVTQEDIAVSLLFDVEFFSSWLVLLRIRIFYNRSFLEMWVL